MVTSPPGKRARRGGRGVAVSIGGETPDAPNAHQH